MKQISLKPEQMKILCNPTIYSGALLISSKYFLIFLRTILGAALTLVLASPAWADFTGKVVADADGDTITALNDTKQVKVRLVEIDAPEKAQAFGNDRNRL